MWERNFLNKHWALATTTTTTKNEWRRSCFVFCLQDKTNVCVYSCITSLRFLFLFPPDYSVSVTLTTYVSLKTNEWVSIIFFVATADSSFNGSHVYNCKVSINLCQLLTNWMAHLWKVVDCDESKQMALGFFIMDIIMNFLALVIIADFDDFCFFQNKLEED